MSAGDHPWCFDGGSLAPGESPVKLLPDFFVFEQALRNGVYLASALVDGDDKADLIAGGGPGGGPRVFILGGDALLRSSMSPLANFFAGDVSDRGGVRVAVSEMGDPAVPVLVTGAGDGSGSTVRAYRLDEFGPFTLDEPARTFSAFPGFNGGVFVG